MYYGKARSSLRLLEATRTYPHCEATKMALEGATSGSQLSEAAATPRRTELKGADAAVDLESPGSWWR